MTIDRDPVDTTMPTTDAEHEAFDNGLRSRALSPEQNPAHDQTGNATDELAVGV